MTMRRRGSLIIATAFAASACWAQQDIDPKLFQQTYIDAKTSVVNETVNGSNLSGGSDRILWTREFNRTGSRYIQFHFDQIRSDTGADYSIQIVSLPSEQSVKVYRASEFAATTDFLTDLLPAQRMQVRLVGGAGGRADVSFRLVHILWQATPGEHATPQSIVPRWDPVQTAPSGSSITPWASAVAVLHIGPSDVTCTGVLIDERTVATNYHCMVQGSLQFLRSENAPQKLCGDVIVEFDYLQRGGRGVSTRCAAVRVKKDLDVALLTVDPVAIRTAAGDVRNPVRLIPADERPSGRLSIIHHPVGLSLQYEENCRVRGGAANDVLHDCVTTTGSSGSPIFDEQMRWIGLHYKGPYPITWTIRQVEQHIQDNGPTYNRARLSTEIISFAQASAPPN